MLFVVGHDAIVLARLVDGRDPESLSPSRIELDATCGVCVLARSVDDRDFLWPYAIRTYALQVIVLARLVDGRDFELPGFDPRPDQPHEAVLKLVK
jgi:hypothetical protein